MNLLEPFLTSIASVGVILAAMAVVALVETALPLHVRGRWNRSHLGPNFALTFITFGTNIIFNVALVTTLVSLQYTGFGVLRVFPFRPFVNAAIAVVALDFSFYVAHICMHKTSGFWRIHSVHHSDPAVDVTTTIRQHPVESVIRYGFMATAAIALGASPGVFGIYRVWSALSGLFEHSNIRMPRRLDSLLSLVVSTPNMHKVHHSRAVEETDTNYGNIFSLFDRLFFTFTPSWRGVNITYGLDGFDDPALQTTAALLIMPFARGAAGNTIAAASQLSSAMSEQSRGAI
jgi:sterol desaturase/sphingolipid hydroxylase (fatty acid hydroxylase superfamily)